MKHSLKIVFILCCLSTFLLTGCSAKEPDWKIYSNKIIQISYPASWQIGDLKKVEINPKPEVIIYAPTPDGEFTSNINLMIQYSQYLAPSASEQADMTAESYRIMGKSSE